MKKVLALFLAAIMLIVPVGVLADSADSGKIEDVLIAVKSKITVPDKLSEFSDYVSESSKRSYYHFEWSDKEYKENMSVSADGDGRIVNYYHYKNAASGKKISSFSKNDIVAFASQFMMNALPETNRGEGDVLTFDEKSYNASGNMQYVMTFERKKESVTVKDNYATVTVGEADGELYIRNMSVSYNYDTDFSLSEKDADNYKEKYMEAYPTELVYVNEYDYTAKNGKAKITPSLVYRIKDNVIGYIDAETGEMTEEDKTENETYKGAPGVMEDSAVSGSGNRNEILTPEEIEELRKIEGLLSKDDIEKIVKKLPYVNFSKDLVLESSNLSKNNEDKYIYRLYFTNNNDKDYGYLNVSAEAGSGKIINLAASSEYTQDGELSEKDVKAANRKIAEFLEAAAIGEIAECKEETESVYKQTVRKNYVRYVNGVKYIDNGISVSFNSESGAITSYNLNFTEGEFTDPQKAISADAAYSKIIEYAPIVPLYIVNGGKYKKVFTLDCYGMEIDAVTGEIKRGYLNEQTEYSYSDIEGHWAQEAAEKLSEIQVGFEGGKLEPKKAVTQKEFLKLVASGIYSKYYAQYSDEELYNLLVSEGVIKEEEKSPNSPIKREDAFVFIIRFAKLDKVAELSDIYKVSYADGHLLSESKIGYAAILSGLGVICGNGGTLRPQDTLTRAEAVTVLYNYLIKL